MKESLAKQSTDHGRTVHHATSFAISEGWQNHNQNMAFANQWQQIPAPQYAPATSAQFDQTRKMNLQGELPPPPPRPAIEAPPESSKSVNTINRGYNVVLAISGGSNQQTESKRQRKEYVRRINHVGVGPTYINSRWSNIPITFSQEDMRVLDY